MLVTAGYALWVDGPMMPTDTDVTYSPDDIWHAKWSGFVYIFTAMAYVFIMQYNVPGNATILFIQM